MLRGMHFQCKPFEEIKPVAAVAPFDVIVITPGFPTFTFS
jgi:hypothetical protein